MMRLWTVFELLVNVFQGCITVWFVKSYLGTSKNGLLKKISGVFFAALFAIAVTILNNYMLFEGLYAFIYVAILFIYSVICLKGAVLKKLAASVYAMVVVLGTTVIISSLMIALMDSTQTELLQSRSADRLLVVLIIQISIFFIFSLSLKILNKEVFALTSMEWLMMAMIFAISIFISERLNTMAVRGLSQSEKINIALIFIGILLINIVTFYCLIGLGKKNKTASENIILKLKEEHNRNFIESAEREYRILKELRHDTKENYDIIYNYIKTGNSDDALKYIEDIYGELSGKEVFIKTNNQTFDAVVNSKFTVAKSMNIECTCISSSDFKKIDDYDLVRLLSNMLENAITASKSVKAPKIELIVKDEGKKNIFILKNKIDASILSDNPDLKTTKKDMHNHGMGISIIKNIASRYNGRCDFYEENGFFNCLVVINPEQH